jgi:tetratricopeptide (TPR) repeat protein
MLRTLLLGLFLFTGTTPASQQAQIYFDRGNQLYEEGDFSNAREQYEKAVNEGLVNAVLYYNFANTLFRLNKLGGAILYYEKALKLTPTDEDIKANLKFAYAQTIDKHPEPEHNVFTKFIWYLHSSYDLNLMHWIALCLFSLIFLLGTVMLFLPGGARLIIYPLIVLILTGLLFIVPSLTLRINEQESVRFAIVLSPVLQLYSGPGESYQVLSKVHEGTKFKIVELSNNWAKVKLPNGASGYVKYAELGKI